jgi:hypothetical protein
MDMELWSEAVQASRKDIERTCGSMRKRFRVLVTTIANSTGFCVEQIIIACCVLHKRLLDYNYADNWRERMLIVTRKGELDGYVPVSIDHDPSFLSSRYRNDPELYA